MDLFRSRNFKLLTRVAIIITLAVVYGVAPDGPPSTEDQCSPNPCQNNAICRARGDGYSCFCVPGFQGAHCQIDVNECASEPCRNGATCEDRLGNFSCLCPPGFTGATCEIRVDDCQSQPCLNGGGCHGYPGGFTCTCTSGFQGHRCEVNVDECQGQPCQNGGVCTDGVDDFSCDCSHTAFSGRVCETPRPPCHSQPCLNSAICQDNQGNYTCDCWPGFAGRQCGVDINECGSNPCMHGGSCIERSRKDAYGVEPLLPGHFDQRFAAGYVCRCPPGTTGSLCQEVMDQCDPNPCQNGGRCESSVGGYTCHCLGPRLGGGAPFYGGPNCERRLTGCEGHQCQNGGVCSPLQGDGGAHGYTCSCAPGFSGNLCQTSTTFSFERRGYVRLRAGPPVVEEEEACVVLLSFQTLLPVASLVRRRGGGSLLSLELEKGKLRLTLEKEEERNSTGAGIWREVLELPYNVTDGEWHTVKAVLEQQVLSLELLDEAWGCGGGRCLKLAEVRSDLAWPASHPRDTLIGGGLEESNLSEFIGCMRDVFVDGQLVEPEAWPSDSAVSVSPGCRRRDRCLDVPCRNGGDCVNLWQGYQCRCPRPYTGQDCEKEHIAARFGNEDSRSYAAFAVDEDLDGDLSVSLFLRTRRQDGLILALTNDSSHFLDMWLEDGKVTVQLDSWEGLRSEGAVDDGRVHFVSVQVAERRLTLYVGGEKQGDAEVGSAGVQAGDAVHVGGLPLSRATSVFGGYFKGCIQDVRINDRGLQFFGGDASVTSLLPKLLENVTAGCTGDNVCSDNPCLNGGVCYSMWDDFTCDCPPKTAGRRCEEVRWCELSPCPPDSECRTLSEGFECYANASFFNDSTVLTYQGNGKISRNLTNLSLDLRTRKRNAAVLHAEAGSAFLTLSVQDGLLVVELQSSSPSEVTEGAAEEEKGTSAVSLSSGSSVSDGEWHSVQLFMATPWALTSRWTLVVDGRIEEAATSRSRLGNLDFLRQGVNIYLGGLAPDAGWSLAGCLGTVELGGVALPYLNPSDVTLPWVQEEQFVLTSPQPPVLGCFGAPVCEPDPCWHGGECQDRFNAFECSCADGWAGKRCDFFLDTCASNPCVHGNCSVSGVTYSCACAFGFAGVNCEQKVDVCENHLCANGGTCLQGPDRYACLCADNYTGPLCGERIEEIPWYIVVRKVRPKLPVSVCGDDTRNYTCFNGGNCTDRELSCDCPPGFIGHRCEQEVDECKSNPCQNGGYCRNLVDKFVCVCDMSFAGDMCQTDLTAQGSTSDLLLAVSLSVAVLLLLLVLASVGLAAAALGRRATRGTYSPSRQEKDGSRVEMWSITQPPPTERLI